MVASYTQIRGAVGRAVGSFMRLRMSGPGTQKWSQFEHARRMATGDTLSNRKRYRIQGFMLQAATNNQNSTNRSSDRVPQNPEALASGCECPSSFQRCRLVRHTVQISTTSIL
jgi:hypothetical protein